MASKFMLLMFLVAAIACVHAAPRPFFDAIYDAVVGNGRRTYGYDYNNYNGGYNGYTGYNGYNGYNDYGYRQERAPAPARKGKSWGEICRVHFPDSIAQPGKGGIVCPY